MTRFLKLTFQGILFAMLANYACAEPSAHKKAQHTHKAKRVTKKNKKHTVHHARVYKPQYAAPTEKQINAALPTSPSAGIASFFTRRVASVEGKMVEFVHKTVSNLKYSVYKFGGGHFEPAQGVYVLDCSDYVDNVLQTVDPKAYSNLVDYTGSVRPTTQHYYEFFNDLDEDNSQYGWTKITDVSELQPGDVLVFRYKRGMRTTGGHVMIVMDKPMRDANVYLVRVADSAASGHSHDTRQGNTSGIGIGTLLLKADPSTGKPTAFAWRVGSSWKSNVKFAMGRPVYSS